MMGNRNQFLTKIEELKLYIAKFDKNGIMKPKDYLSNSIIGGEKQWPIIIITHDKCIFSINDDVQKA